ncbi:MAG: RNA ligase (ATP) [Zoogloeaceae bacterium]|jgi:RNA ligase (TIGR02306 family)|nr:RNA ligase (ATP) [Zoogloeaceae bacterium]
MSERKLASIRVINDIRPIPGADAIECAVVGGWKVVVKKGDFQPGDLAIYLEIDSWVPHTLAPFLSKGEPKVYNDIPGERLRTVKLRGQISQGLLLPLSGSNGVEGQDLTETLGIQKWEPPQKPARQMLGPSPGTPFPAEVPRTDQERVQNLLFPEILAHRPYEVTEKLDGMSCTLYLDSEEKFRVCSRNITLDADKSSALWNLALRLEIEDRMRNAECFGLALQGEVIGPGIQGNRYQRSELEFHLFDIYDTNQERYLFAQERKNFAALLGLQHVPILGVFDGTEVPGSHEEITGVEQLIQSADGKTLLCASGGIREGLVFKALHGEHFSFKAISNKFLLKEE